MAVIRSSGKYSLLMKATRQSMPTCVSFENHFIDLQRIFTLFSRLADVLTTRLLFHTYVYMEFCCAMTAQALTPLLALSASWY